MAKKGQAVQLQQELSSDDDWDKIHQRDGLIVVDIYSEWCGPCSAMIANLKKLKLEVGGDNLHLAIAKADSISYLERFRNKSEPTWMFIANGKMVNLMFGANAPKLVRLIMQELQNEAEVKKGDRERVFIEISELAPEEQVRYEAAKQLEEEATRIEIEKAAQVLHDKRLGVANTVLEHYSKAGIVLVFPQAAKQGQSTLAEFWPQVGLTVSVTEKCQINEGIIDELLYFAEREKEFTKMDIYNLTNAQSLVYLIKPQNAEEFNNDIDSTVLEVVFGESKCPPGSPESPAQRLYQRTTKGELNARLFGGSKTSIQSKLASRKKVAEEDDKKGDEDDVVELSGLWAPPNANTKATAIKLLFPKQYDPIALPQQPPVPPHVAVIFEAFKRREIMNLMNEYKSEVIRYGFFSDENAETTKLIAKTLPLFEQVITAGTTFGEKLIVQLAKVRPEPLKAFTELGPTFVSKNSVEGEHECKAFFPDNYDEPEGGSGVIETKKKKKRGKKAKEATVPSQEVLVEGEPGAVDEAVINEDEAEGEHAEAEGEGESEGEGEGDGEGEGEGELQVDEENVADNEEVLPEGADKATSPMPS